jgi:hypothetical protein
LAALRPIANTKPVLPCENRLFTVRLFGFGHKFPSLLAAANWLKSKPEPTRLLSPSPLLETPYVIAIYFPQDSYFKLY